MSTTHERLCHILVSEHQLTPGRLHPDTALQDLGIDSLGTVELLWNVETAFALKLPLRPPPMNTLADVTRWIDSLMALQARSGVRHAA
ncbi:MAG: phosphopantetheine-binding protein [Rubrivivax sp.]|nr:phosphopantetheine-binding protein [Rubrivivax sp.]MDP3223710.1 phosphopantetheine-binding protein [Rubrivivax sp.]